MANAGRTGFLPPAPLAMDTGQSSFTLNPVLRCIKGAPLHPIGFTKLKVVLPARSLIRVLLWELELLFASSRSLVLAYLRRIPQS
jgi:hypothetical protein